MQQTHSTGAPGFLPAQSGNALPDIELTEVDGEPRARDTEIAERLGYERPRAIRQIIDRNRDEIEAFGPLATRRGESRGQEYDEYWLTEEQALLVASKSDAPNAAQVRHMVIKVFVAWRRGHLVPAMPTTAQAFASAFTMLAEHERRQAVQGQQIKAIEAKVDQVAQAHVILDKLPSDCEYITVIRKRMNKQYGLSETIVDTIMRNSPYAPTTRALVKNQHVEAAGAHNQGFSKKEVSAVFRRFVDECQMVSATLATHPFIEGRFKLTGKAGA